MSVNLQLAARAVFWTALISVAVLALGPVASAPGTSDKVQHFVAFLVLAGLAVAAYPARALPVLWLALVAYGGAIELLQGTESIGRDADIGDWLTDGAGALACLTSVALFRRFPRRSAEHST